MKPTTARCAIALALLKGDILSIADGFSKFSVSNIPRELGRSFIHPKTGFGVAIAKTECVGTSSYGIPSRWFQYRLIKAPYNQPAIKKMKLYIKDHLTNEPPKTEKQRQLQAQLELLLK